MNDNETRLVVRLPIRFDPPAVESVRTRFCALVDQPGVDSYVVEGSDVEEMCSSALGLLVALRHAATLRGVRFVIRRPSATLVDAILDNGLGDRLLGLAPASWYQRAAWAAGLAANA